MLKGSCRLDCKDSDWICLFNGNARQGRDSETFPDLIFSQFEYFAWGWFAAAGSAT